MDHKADFSKPGSTDVYINGRKFVVEVYPAFGKFSGKVTNDRGKSYIVGDVLFDSSTEGWAFTLGVLHELVGRGKI